MKLYLASFILILVPSICFAQARYPHVDEIVKAFDADEDGFLTQPEVAKSNYARGRRVRSSAVEQRVSAFVPGSRKLDEKGDSVGEGYRELMNALIDTTITHPSGFIPSERERNQKRLPQNSLLYVVIGDPALVPFGPQPLFE